MRCVRCRQELPGKGNRCARCAALGTGTPSSSGDDEFDFGELRLRAQKHRGAPRAARAPGTAKLDLNMPLPLRMPIPPPVLTPVAPVAVQISDPEPEFTAAADLPQPAARARAALPGATVDARLAEARVRAGIARAHTVATIPAARRLIALGVDAAIVLVTLAGFVALATAIVGPATLAPHGIGSRDYWLDLLFGQRMATLWFTLGAALALAYSWLFGAACGRTPGMAVAHLRVVRIRGGGALTPLQALARALFAIPSAALGLFGFVLAFTSGQALHDRLARAMVIADA